MILTKPELKPCPRCGGRVELIDAVGIYQVVCEACEAKAWVDDPDVAIMEWNTKAGETG